ncbi:MAG: Uma2 family endonuclease [Acidobacteria bacterium]|nr:Uma2 family endonuclease [Acidobacteriota bacterium]
MDTSAVQVRRWTRREYDRMIEAGVLNPEDRVELIGGEILTVTPQSSVHATCVSLVQEAMRSVFGRDAHVRVQLPLALGAESEPEPDVAVVTGSARDYRDAHPQSALLVVEVADTTLAYDRGTKGSLYARAGVPDYWIVNLTESILETHRDPTSHSAARFGWHYRPASRFDSGETVEPLSRPGARIPVSDLLP